MQAYEIKNYKISNSYYNLALDRIAEGCFFDATVLLKKSLLFNKKNSDSRNLLGLIFYKQGEIVDALCQWIINKNLNHEEILSTRYISAVQNDEKIKSLFNCIKIYNSALIDISDERKDLAMHKLYKAIELNPNHIKSLALLSLLLLDIKNHIKAGSYLLKAQKIDKSNFLVNKLMNYTLKNTKQKELKEQRLMNVYSDKKIQEDDVILPNRYINLTVNQTIIYILIGILIGLIGYHKICTPVVRRAINENLNDSIMRYADIINDQNKTIRDLTVDNNELKSNYSIVNERVKRYEEQNEKFTMQYEALTDINRLFEAGSITQAIDKYVSLDKSNITDDTLLVLLNAARSNIESLGAPRICELGTQEWNAGRKDKAVEYYLLSLSIGPDDPETMFLLGRLYQSMGQENLSNELFDKIIAEHSNSNYARRAKDARGY